MFVCYSVIKLCSFVFSCYSVCLSQRCNGGADGGYQHRRQDGEE